MKKVKIQITQTFEEHPADVLKSLVGKTLEFIYTYNMQLDNDLLDKSSDNHVKLFFKTSDGFIYEMVSHEYTEDYYFDIKKTSIKSVEQVEGGFVEFRLAISFLIERIFIFTFNQESFAEKEQISNVYGEKWHSEKRSIKFKEEFYPNVHIGEVSEDSHLIFANEKGKNLCIGTQLSPYFIITTNESYINDLLTGNSWIKDGGSPYKLSRIIE
jgi:hypothetical protein